MFGSPVHWHSGCWQLPLMHISQAKFSTGPASVASTTVSVLQLGGPPELLDEPLPELLAVPPELLDDVTPELLPELPLLLDDVTTPELLPLEEDEESSSGPPSPASPLVSPPHAGARQTAATTRATAGKRVDFTGPS
jgi:hypothetical protein